MSRPVPVTQSRPPLAPFRPPPLRHETDSSNSEVDEQTPPIPPSYPPSHPPPGRYFSPASHGSGSFSSTGSGSRPSSLPLPPLQQSAYLRPPLVSPRELLNPMSIASALADTAADMPLPRGGGTGSSITGGIPSSAHHRASPLPPDVSNPYDQYGGASRGISGNGSGSYTGSYSGGQIPPMLPHRRSSSANSPYDNNQPPYPPHHQHGVGAPYGQHGRAPYPTDLGGAPTGGGMGAPGMPPPIGLSAIPEDRQRIVERLRAMDQSLREATLAQRRLVDETMRSWNSSEDGK